MCIRDREKTVRISRGKPSDDATRCVKKVGESVPSNLRQIRIVAVKNGEDPALILPATIILQKK
jgi:hypothetical protein